MSDTLLLMRTVAPDGISHGGFRWPLEVGAIVEAPDWNPEPRCGGGLHGLPRGEGDGFLIDWSDTAVWMAVEAQTADVVCFEGKAKARRVVVRALGNRQDVTAYPAYLQAQYPRCAIVGAPTAEPTEESKP